MSSFTISHESEKDQEVDLASLRGLVINLSSLGKLGVQVVELVFTQQGKNPIELEQFTRGYPCSTTIRKYCELAVQKNILFFAERGRKIPGRYGGREYSPRSEIIPLLWMAIRLLKDYLNSQRSIEEILREINNTIEAVPDENIEQRQEIQKASNLASIFIDLATLERLLHDFLRQKYSRFTEKYRDVAVFVFIREVREGQEGVRLSEPRDELGLSDSWINLVMRRLVKVGLLRRKKVAQYHLYFVTENFLKALPPDYTEISACIIGKVQKPAFLEAELAELVVWDNETVQQIPQEKTTLVQNCEQGEECTALVLVSQNCFLSVGMQPEDEQPTFEEIIEHLFASLEQVTVERAALQEALEQQREETERLRVRVQSDSDLHAAERHALLQSKQAEIDNLQRTVQRLVDDQRQKYVVAMDVFRRSQTLAQKR